MKTILNVEINNLRPTQSGLGMEEVNHKIQQIKSMSKQELQSYIDEKVVPVVLGPEKEYYLIDHHHYAYSMHVAGHNTIKAEVVADLSNLDDTKFWTEMEKRKWTWLFLPNGTKITPKHLPKTLYKLINDPFRSLAWGVRELKGFNVEDKVPFFEFMWGNFYREYLTETLVAHDFELATKIALKLSTHDIAKNLPGYKGQA